MVKTDKEVELYFARRAIFAPQPNATMSVAPANLGTVNVPNFTQSEMVCYLNPAGILAVLTVNMPPSPVDGQVVNISANKLITLLNIGGSGASIFGAISTLLAGGFVRYGYIASDNLWVRLV